VAANKGYISIVKFLVEKGLDTEEIDKLGRKPIHDALVCGHFEIVSFLKDKTH